MQTSFLRWAGSKKKLLSKLLPYWNAANYDRYVEPFAGSAMLYFSAKPSRALLADTNAELINMYRAVKWDWLAVHLELRKWKPDEKTYYKIRDAEEVKLFTNGKAGKAGRAQWYVAKRNVIEGNKEFIDQWKVVVSRANAGGQKRDWQIEVFDNHSAFGRARVGLGSFKTKAEAENFYAYCTTYLIRFLFLMTEESLTSLARKVPDVLDYTKNNKLLDFTKDLNAQLYALCGLTAAEVKYIEKTIIDMDASRSRRKSWGE